MELLSDSRDEYRLHAHEIGPKSDPPVLFLHGFMGSNLDWSGVCQAVGADYRCIAPDLPRHGESLWPEEATLDIEKTCAQLEKMMNERTIDVATLVGYSMGGRIALHFALTRPSRVSKLVIESGSPGLESEEARATRRGEDAARATVLREHAFPDFLDAWYRQPLFSSLHNHPGLLKDLIARRLDNNPRQLARSLEELGTGQQLSHWERLRDLAMPTLLVTGALDRKFTDFAHEMLRRNRSIKHAVIPDAGHNVHLEALEAYVNALRHFLAAPISG